MADEDIDAIPTHVTAVVRAEQVGPVFRRLTVGGAGLERFVSIAPDEFVYVFVPPPGRTELGIGTDFSWLDYYSMDEAVRPVGAYYTVRHHRPDAGEVDLDVFLHDEPGTPRGGRRSPARATPAPSGARARRGRRPPAPTGGCWPPTRPGCRPPPNPRHAAPPARTCAWWSRPPTRPPSGPCPRGRTPGSRGWGRPTTPPRRPAGPQALGHPGRRRAGDAAAGGPGLRLGRRREPGAHGAAPLPPQGGRHGPRAGVASSPTGAWRSTGPRADDDLDDDDQ